MTTYTRKAFYGFLWVGIGAVVANLFSYLLRLLLARSLTVEEYGLVYAVMAMFGLVSAFVHLGFGEALAKYTAQHSVRDERVRIKELMGWAARILYAATLLIALIAFFVADWLALAYFKNPAAAMLVRIYACSVLLSPIDYILLGVLQGRQRLELHALYNMVRNTSLFFLSWLLIAAGFGPASVMLAYVAALLLSYALFPFLISAALPDFFSRHTSGKPSVRRVVRSSAANRSVAKRSLPEPLQALFAYGLPVMLTSVAGVILFYTDTFMITLFSSLEQVGIYQAALPTANILMFFVGMLTIVLLPLVAELWEKRREALILQAVRELYRYVVLFLLPFIVAIVFYPDIILNLLFGAPFIAGADILRVLMMAVLFLSLHAVNAATLSGIGKPKETTKAVIVGALCNLIAKIILVPILGGLGAGISTLLSAIIMWAMSTMFLRRVLRVPLPFAAWSKAFLAGVVFFVVLVGSRALLVGWDQYLKVVLSVGVGMLAYVLALFLFGAVSLKELLDLKARVLARR